jgi:hypothetical protein
MSIGDRMALGRGLGRRWRIGAENVGATENHLGPCANHFAQPSPTLVRSPQPGRDGIAARNLVKPLPPGYARQAFIDTTRSNRPTTRPHLANPALNRVDRDDRGVGRPVS